MDNRMLSLINRNHHSFFFASANAASISAAFVFSFSEKSGYISVILVPDVLERQVAEVVEETQ